MPGQPIVRVKDVHKFFTRGSEQIDVLNGLNLDVPEGEVLTITIIRLPVNEGGGGLERSAGGWKGLIDAEELKRNIYADRVISTRPEPRL